MWQPITQTLYFPSGKTEEMRNIFLEAKPLRYSMYLYRNRCSDTNLLWQIITGVKRVWKLAWVFIITVCVILLFFFVNALYYRKLFQIFSEPIIVIYFNCSKLITHLLTARAFSFWPKSLIIQKKNSPDCLLSPLLASIVNSAGGVAVFQQAIPIVFQLQLRKEGISLA